MTYIVADLSFDTPRVFRKTGDIDVARALAQALRKVSSMHTGVDVFELTRVPIAPLDPAPWTIHSIDSGTIRFETQASCWGGYRTHWEPRDGYAQDMEEYPEEVTRGR